MRMGNVNQSFTYFNVWDLSGQFFAKHVASSDANYEKTEFKSTINDLHSLSSSSPCASHQRVASVPMYCIILYSNIFQIPYFWSVWRNQMVPFSWKNYLVNTET